jgi:predicted dehydrogenase
MKVCVVGCGAASQSLHIPAWKRAHDAEITAVVDLNIDQAKQVGRKIGADYYQHLEEIHPKQVDIVDICTPTSTHFPIAKTALSNGFNVITEKPISPESKKGQILVDLAKEQGLKLGVVQHFVYSRAVMKAKRALDSGELGSDVVIELSFPVMYVKPSDWSARPEEGGLLWEHGIHPSYILNYLMGEPEQISAIGEEPGIEKACTISAHLKRGNIRAILNLGPFGRYVLRVSGTKKELNARLVADRATFLPPLQPPFVGEDAKPEPNARLLSPYFHGGFGWAYRDLRESLSLTAGYVVRGLRYLMYGMGAFDQQRLFEHFASWVEGKGEFYSTGSLGVSAIRTLERIRACLGVHNSIQSKSMNTCDH